MKDQIGVILKLHQFDQQISNFEQSLAKIKPELQELETLVASHQAALKKIDDQLAVLEESKKVKERTVETSEMRLRDLQKNLSQIKTNKEYQAALKEMTDSKKNNKILEDQTLELMTQIEALKTEKIEIETNLQASTKNYQARKETLDVQSEELRSQIQQTERSKEKLYLNVDSGVLNQYLRVRKSRPDAVSEVVSGMCQACRIKIPPQMYIEIHKLQSIYTCPSCHRLLYLSEWLDVSDPKAAGKIEENAL